MYRHFIGCSLLYRGSSWWLNFLGRVWHWRVWEMIEGKYWVPNWAGYQIPITIIIAVLTPTLHPLFETDMDIWGESLLYKTCGQACSSGLPVHSFLKSGSCVWHLMSATRFIFKAVCSPVEHFASNQFISPSCCENKRKTQTFLYSSFPAIPQTPHPPSGATFRRMACDTIEEGG